MLGGVDVNGHTYKKIEDTRPGDYVLSRDQYDPDDVLSPHRVRNVFRKTSDHLRVLTITGDDGNVETIQTTDSHPFWVQGRGWTDAGHLAAGDLVQESDGSWQSVFSSTRIAHADGITVYNLEVEGDHTYFVEDGFGDVDAVWVHNATGGVCSIRNQPRPLKDVPGQIISPGPSGKTLGTNLNRLGIERPKGTHAHHIVAGKQPEAQLARDVLKKHNININEANNGVFLAPPGKSAPDPTMGHGTTFGPRYSEAVSARIDFADGAGGRTGVLNELAAIREDLLEGRKFW